MSLAFRSNDREVPDHSQPGPLLTLEKIDDVYFDDLGSPEQFLTIKTLAKSLLPFTAI